MMSRSSIFVAVLVVLGAASVSASMCGGCVGKSVGPCSSVFGVCYADDPVTGACPAGTRKCNMCDSCSKGSQGSCRHNLDNSCVGYNSQLVCPPGTTECKPSGGTSGSSTTTGTTSGSTTTTTGGSTSGGSGTTGGSTTTGGGSTTGGSSSGSSCPCWFGTQGPCLGASGVCYDLFPGLNICPGGTKQCESCNQCTSGSAGPCRHAKDGTCFMWLAGTTMCPPGTLECATHGHGGSGSTTGTTTTTTTTGGSTTTGTTGSTTTSGSSTTTGGGSSGTCGNCLPGTAGDCRAPHNGVCYQSFAGMCPPGTQPCTGTASVPAHVDAEFTVQGVSAADFDAAAVQEVKVALALAADTTPAHVEVKDISSSGSGVVLSATIVTPGADPTATAAAIEAASASGQLATGTAIGTMQASNVVAVPAQASAGAGAGMSSTLAITLLASGVALVTLLAVAAVVVKKRRSARPSSPVSIRVRPVRSANQW